jgi:hypothetical protein
MTPRVLVTLRPGPVLHLWQDGREVARVPLDLHGALALVEALLREARAAQARDGKPAEPR